MIDSHCHLDHEPLFENLDEVLKRSKNVGIKKILTICTTLKSFENIIKIINKDDIIYGTFGIHPHETSNNTVKKDEIIQNVNKYKKIIGIGETGLDFYYNNSDNIKILMHCFTGSNEFAKKLLSLNAYFSASGIITFKNSVDLQETFKFLPIENLLIETDSPFLAPVPNRGKKNEPSFIKFTAEKLAKIKDLSNQTLIDKTTQNFYKLFSK